MTPLESTITLCVTGLMVCAAFLGWYAICYWVHLLRVACDQRIVFDFNRACRKQRRQIMREIALLHGREQDERISNTERPGDCLL